MRASPASRQAADSLATESGSAPRTGRRLHAQENARRPPAAGEVARKPPREIASLADRAAGRRTARTVPTPPQRNRVGDRRSRQRSVAQTPARALKTRNAFAALCVLAALWMAPAS